MGFVQPQIHTEPGPMRVRFFKGPVIADLENQINEWLSENARREIVDVRQTVSPLIDGRIDLVVSVWYMEN